MVLFALVLAIRIAIPTGFMPTSAPNGFVISICTGMGEAKAFLPIEKKGDTIVAIGVAIIALLGRTLRRRQLDG